MGRRLLVLLAAVFLAVPLVADASRRGMFYDLEKALDRYAWPPSVANIQVTEPEDRRDPFVVSLAMRGDLRRGDILTAAYHDGRQETPLDDGRGLTFEGELDQVRLPLQGYLFADTVDGARVVQPLCLLEETYFGSRQPKGTNCWGATAAGNELARAAGVKGGALRASAAGFSDKALHLRVGLVSPKGEDWVLTLFLHSESGARVPSRWASVNYRPGEKGCFVGKAGAGDVLSNYREDKDQLTCALDKGTLWLRVDTKFFGVRRPDAVTIVPVMHTGRFGEDRRVLDVLPPTRIEAPGLRAPLPSKPR